MAGTRVDIFGWKFWDKLRLDGMLTYGQIDYRAQAAAVTGGWDADRITGMLRLAGRYGFALYYVEPSAPCDLGARDARQFRR